MSQSVDSHYFTGYIIGWIGDVGRGGRAVISPMRSGSVTQRRWCRQSLMVSLAVGPAPRTLKERQRKNYIPPYYITTKQGPQDQRSKTTQVLFYIKRTYFILGIKFQDIYCGITIRIVDTTAHSPPRGPHHQVRKRGGEEGRNPHQRR